MDPSFDDGGQEVWVAKTEFPGALTERLVKAVVPGTWSKIPRFRSVFSHKHKKTMSKKKSTIGPSLQ